VNCEKKNASQRVLDTKKLFESFKDSNELYAVFCDIKDQSILFFVTPEKHVFTTRPRIVKLLFPVKTLV
jgi:hypothetical protein